MKEFWYHAYFDIVGSENEMTDDYTCIKAETMEQADKEAIEWAKEREVEGEDYSDAGHVELSLVEVSEVYKSQNDENNEWVDIRFIYC